MHFESDLPHAGPELASSEDFRILVESVQDYAIFRLDTEGRVSSWNPGAQKIKGYTKEEILGRHFSTFYTEEDNRAGKPAWELKEAAEKGRVTDEGWRVRKDGTRFWAYVVISAMYDADHRLMGFAKVTRDMTERKLADDNLQLANQELREAKDAAEAANLAKTQFLANMSHEIRTPLNGIIGVTELLNGTPLSGHQRDLLETLHVSSDNLLTVLNAILDFSKIEYDKLELDFHAFSLLGLIDEVSKLFYYQMLKKSIELTYLIDPDLFPGYIGDGLRIRQILVNLVSNALKFTETGSIVIDIKKVLPDAGDDADRLHFSVKDTGIGISDEQRKNLFLPFSQLDSSTARRYGGSGLGLAISQRLVTLMGGTISVESKVGCGSTFCFELPLRRALGEPNLDEERTLFAGKRVLIVDDLETNRNLLHSLLSHWGFETSMAANSEETVALLSQGQRFDVALIDYHMPTANGLSLARKIAHLNLDPPLPLILISSYTGKYPESELRSAGYLAAIAKPVRQSVLKSTLLEILISSDHATPAFLREAEEIPLPLAHQILVVEDNRVNQKILLQMLKRLGFDADIVDDGRKALLAVPQKAYSLILMDIHMPGLDGLEATKLIREKFPQGDSLRIVALTADSTDDERQKCLDAGMDDYMVKPVNLTTLRKMIEKHALRDEMARLP